MAYRPSDTRYEKKVYRRCGNSGLKLPAISLGLWHNFGGDTAHELKRSICQTAFDNGITHFDLANNYDPPAGSAEEAFGEILRTVGVFVESARNCPFGQVQIVGKILNRDLCGTNRLHNFSLLRNRPC
jgi:diketogulonate reductase-like aldo/keto reductase